MFALEMTFHLFSANFCHMLSGHFAWQVQYLVSLEGDIGCSAHCIHEVSYVTRMNYACHFSWQAQYLVSLEGDIGCSAHCK